MIKKYTIKLIGWSIRITAHSLNAEQANLVQAYSKENNILLNDLLESMESVINDYDHYDTNLWDIEASLPDELNIIVEDDQGSEILTFTIHETGGDVGQNYHDSLTYSALPNAENPNVLVYQEDNKGVIYGCVFESVTTPTPKDFTFKNGQIITPDGNFTFIESIYFKGKKLDKDYEFSSLQNIATTSQLFLKKTKK